MASAAKRTKAARSAAPPPSGVAPGRGIGVAPASFATASESAPSAATRRRRSSPSSSSRRTFTSSSASANGSRPTLPLRAEGERVTAADPFPQRSFDLVVQADQPNRSARQQRGQHQPADDEQGRSELDRPKANVRDPTRADPAPARPKARTLGARRHAAHGGPGASPRRHANPSDQ